MAGRVKELKQEWQHFRSDPPGERFRRHYERTHSGRSTAGTIARLVVGPILIALGVLLWFLPGPGWLCIFAGLTTLAGSSRSLARALDRIEVAARGAARRARTWWKSAPRGTQILAVAIFLASFGGLGCAAWMAVA